nr:histidinol-phosphate transaminase [Coralloluteibacterium stylophorae]
MRAYDPGHDLVALRARFAATELVELGANENAYGPSPAARRAVLDVLNTLHRYPDPTGAALKDALAAHHGVERAAIVLGNGSHELLMLLAQAFAAPGLEVVASRYGFAVYALAAQAAGATLRLAEALPAGHAMPRGHDLDAIAAALTPATRIVYLANPNNPTGTWFPLDALRALLRRVADDVLVVVDEAYAEFVTAAEAGSALTLLADHANLVVTRTFSKAYALAGLRVGYALAHPQLAAVLDRLRESFNVNTPALAAAAAALGDAEHLAWVRERNAEQREALAGALAARGLRVAPSQTNFLLVDFGRDAADLEARLVARGVVVRPVGGYGLPTCLRISIGTRDENRRLLTILDEVLQ